MFPTNRLTKLANNLKVAGFLSSARLADKLIKKANRQHKLIKIFGFSQEVANWIVQHAGPVSVWAADQIIKFYLSSNNPTWADKDGKFTKQNVVESLNKDISALFHWRNYFTSILDWLYHPMVRGTVNIRQLTIFEAKEKAEEFHENLETAGGDIDYKEKNEVFAEYGNGIYWAKIEGGSSAEESRRMGHCGRSGKADTLFSLRENKPFGKGHTVNESHITVAYNSQDGKIYQSKGNKNQKPSQKYWHYIYDLITKLPEFKGFGSEYEASEDYTFKDMTEEQLKNLYAARPNAFEGLSGQIALAKKKIIPAINLIVPIKVDVDDVHRFVRLDRNIRKDLIEEILMGDYHFDVYYTDWSPDVIGMINASNEQKIRDKAKSIPEIDPTLSLKELAEYYDDELYIRDPINMAYSNAYESALQRQSYNEIKDALEHYGTVKQMDYDGVAIDFNVESLLDFWGAEEIEDALEANSNKWNSAILELVSGYDKKPRVDFDYANVDRDEFNSYLEDNL